MAKLDERIPRMREFLLAGWTLTAIAQQFLISRERVRQLCVKHDLPYRPCAYCHEKPSRGQRKSLYCSPECQAAARSEYKHARYNAARGPLLQRECRVCHKMFTPKHRDAIFCGPNCGARATYHRRHGRSETPSLAPRLCEECLRLFTPSKHYVRACSPSCQRSLKYRQWRAEHPLVPPEERACAYVRCLKPFTPKRKRTTRYCSKNCGVMARYYQAKAARA